MQDLTVSIIQTELHWQNAGANLAMLEEKIWEIDGSTDLIILPEMFNSGFTMEASAVAEPMNFTSFKWMRQMAEQTKAVVTGSIVIKEDGHYYNRLIWMPPDGNWASYDKRHLFRMADEHDHYTEGSKKIITDIKGWKICPLICYDLRFPVWIRNTKEINYDLVLFVANWPAPRVSAWDTLLQARAIENLSYCIGVNRVGEDGNGIAYVGHSAVIDPKGNSVIKLGEKESIQTVTLSGKLLEEFRNKFPAYLDADNFHIS